MLKLHGLLQGDALPNSAQLARRLETSAKTIYRDVAFMRDRLGLPIAYDAARRAYRYTEHVGGFPMVEMSESEVFALMVAQKVVQGYSGTPFSKLLDRIFSKLTWGLRDRISFSPAIADIISFGTFGAADIKLETYTGILEGLLHSKVLRLRYRKPDVGVFEPRCVQPYHLAHREGMWYLIGHDIDRCALRVFSLSRVADVQVEKKTFERPKDFNVEAVFAKTLRAYVGGEQRTAVVRFDPESAYVIQERFWHPSQKLRRLRGGGVELRIPFNSDIELERWVLSWGPFAELVAPAGVRRELKRKTQGMASIYAGYSAS